MNDWKSIFASKTFWGAVLAVAGGIAGIWGYTITPEDQQYLVEGGATVVTLVGGVIAVIGRMKASKKIG